MGTMMSGRDIHIHYNGWGHSHTLQRVGSFTYITEGGVVLIYYGGWGYSHILHSGAGSRFALVRQEAAE